MIDKYIIKDFIHNIDILPYKGKFSCYVSAVKNILNYYNLNSFTDLEVCFLTSGINIMYNRENKVFGYDFETSDLSFFGCNTEKVVINNKPNIKKAAIEKLLMAIELGSPIICFVMSDCLKYHKAFKNAEKSRAHAIIIYGYDLKRNKVIIYDPHIKVGYEKYEVYFGDMEFDDFCKGLICYWIISSKFDSNKRNVYQNITMQLKRFLVQELHGNIYTGKNAINYYFNEKLYEANRIELNQLWDFSKMINFDIVINGPCYIGAAADQLESIILQKNTECLYDEWYRLSNQIVRAGYLKDRDKLIEALEHSNLLIEKNELKIKNLYKYLLAIV